MDPLGQDVMIGVAVGLAALYLVVHFMRSRRRKISRCQACAERLRAAAKARDTGNNA